MASTHTERSARAAAMSVLTALTVTGAVVSVFTLLGNPTLADAVADLPLWLAVATGVPMIALCFAVGGGLWGWGAAALFAHPPRPAARTGALSITAMFMLLEVPVHFSQALPVPMWLPLGVHGAFTGVFAAEVALVAGVAATRLSKRLGVARGHRSLGTKVGLVAAVGAVIGSLLALAVGFRVGTPPAFNMVWALYVVVAVAALAAGWTLGWLLGGGAEELSANGAVCGRSASLRRAPDADAEASAEGPTGRLLRS